MEVKNAFKLIFDLSDDQADQMTIKSGKKGLTVSKLIQIFAYDITDEGTSDDPERADLAKRWFKKLSEKYYKPIFLTYLLGLSGGDLRHFIDCLLFLKQKQDEIKKIDAILQLLMEGSIEDMGEPFLSDLKRICRSYGTEVDEKSKDAIKACLEEEKKVIHGKMYVADMGFEPDNLYSAVDVVVQTFDDYCRIYEEDDADIAEELKKVLDWLAENEERFQPID